MQGPAPRLRALPSSARRLGLLILAALLLLTPCATRPLHAQTTATTPAHDATKVFTVVQEIIFYNTQEPRHGMVLPVGAYHLDAEDADFWYFQSPQPVEARKLDRGRPADTRREAGGIRLPKRSNAVAPAGYLDTTGPEKEIIVEITATEFAWMEGKYWKKNF